MSMTMNRRRVRHYDEGDALREAETQHPRFSHGTMMWVGIGTAVVGAGTSLYGANRQSQDQRRANDQNRAAIEAADRGAWNNYLIQRGVYGGNAPTGTIPGMQPGGAVNTRLPLWATMPTADRGGGFGRGFRGLSARGAGGTQPSLMPAGQPEG